MGPGLLTDALPLEEPCSDAGPYFAFVGARLYVNRTRKVRSGAWVKPEQEAGEGVEQLQALKETRTAGEEAEKLEAAGRRALRAPKSPAIRRSQRIRDQIQAQQLGECRCRLKPLPLPPFEELNSE
jgi:hypothetical protein